MKKILFIFFSLSLSLSAFAQIKHVILQVEGLLVESVPARNVPTFDQKDRVLTITTSSGRTANFHMRPDAEALITSLDQRSYTLHFASAWGTPLLQAVLQRVTLKSGENAWDKYKDKLLTDQDMKNGVWDIHKLDWSWKKSVVFIGVKNDLVDSSQANQLINMGPSLYYFETYEAAVAERDRVQATADWSKHKDYFPVDEAAWILDQQRLGQVYLALNRDKFKIQDVQQSIASDPTHDSRRGSLLLEGRFGEKEPRWQLSSDRKNVTGCAEYDLATDQTTRALNNSDCLKIYKTQIAYNLDDRNQTATCQTIDVRTKAIIDRASIDECVLKLPHKTLWQGQNRQACAYYTAELYLLGDAPAGDCGDDHLLINPKTKKPAVVALRPDMERLTLAQIFAAPPPDAQNVLRLWAPYDEDKSVGFTIAKCQDPYKARHAVKDLDTNPDPQCIPDVLYSWGPKVKLTELQDEMGDGTWKKTFRALFAAFSPASTFGYGDIPIRIKLRKGIKWVATDEAHSICASNGYDFENTVFFRYYNYLDLMDFIFCSPGPIASWSYGMPEHYDEIVKDYLRIIDTSIPDTQKEVYLHNRSSYVSAFRSGVDGHNFSDQTMTNYLVEMIDMIKRDEGKIYYNPKIPKKDQTRQAHFATERPIWFNEH